MNASPISPPEMQARIIKAALNSLTPGYWRFRMNNAGTVNIMPAEAPFTDEASVWLMLFSTMLVRRSAPRSTPQPRIAASSEPSIEKPRISEA